MARNSKMAKTFHRKINFLHWAQLDPKFVEKHMYIKPEFKVFISPDVRSLHIVWEEPKDEEGNTIWHQIQDYEDDKSALEFLEDELCMCAEGPIKWTNDIYEAISDFSEHTSENTPVITFK